MKKEGIDIALSGGEFILMKGRADLKVKQLCCALFTGQVCFTNRRDLLEYVSVLKADLEGT